MRFRKGWEAGAALAALLLFGGPLARVATPRAQAQNLGQRVVNGVVLDASSAHASGATVFLRNNKTKSIRSYTTRGDGSFRFVQVNMSDDYDLWADKDGRKSGTKTISSWDTRKEVDEELKLK